MVLVEVGIFSAKSAVTFLPISFITLPALNIDKDVTCMGTFL